MQNVILRRIARAGCSFRARSSRRVAIPIRAPFFFLSMACTCSPNEKYRFYKDRHRGFFFFETGIGDLQSTESLHFRSDAIINLQIVRTELKVVVVFLSLFPPAPSRLQQKGRGEPAQSRRPPPHSARTTPLAPVLCTSLYIPSPLRFPWFHSRPQTRPRAAPFHLFACAFAQPASHRLIVDPSISSSSSSLPRALAVPIH